MSFVDICLTCEKPTTGEAYCSQVCRLQDIDSSSTSSSATSPTYPVFPTPSSTITAASGNGFYLPPAIDWSALRNNARSAAGRQPGSAASSRPVSLCFVPGSGSSSSAMASRTHNRVSSSPRGLTPSSSQASLSSMQSNLYGADHLSRQARDQLREYTSSFDQVRDLRRRMTTS